jgi:hypothetical protein
MNTKTSEKISDTLEKVDKSVIAGTNTDGRLIDTSLGSSRTVGNIHTVRRTSIAVKMAFPGLEAGL